jgi:hypothetical protein
MLKSNGEMALGKHLSDFDEEFFELSENADMNNFFVAYSNLLYAAYLEEQGDYEKSYEKLLLLDKVKIPSLYRAQVLVALLFNELVYQSTDEAVDRAKERWGFYEKDKDVNSIVQMKHPMFMIPYAAKKAFIDLDTKDAWKMTSEAEKLIPRLQNPGSEHFVQVMIERLRERLPEPSIEESDSEALSVEKNQDETITGALPTVETLDEPVSEALPVEETLNEPVSETLPVEETLDELVNEALPVEETPEEFVNVVLPIEETPEETATKTLLEDTEEVSNDSGVSTNNFDDIMEKLRSRRNDS